MSLYYDAASILTSGAQEGSLKSRIYAKNTNLKSKPSHVFALVSEAAKYDNFLKEVIDNAGILVLEPKLTPLLALLLVHDHFFAKGGIATASSHPIRQAVERHKARLQSEFTKARLKRRVATVEQLKVTILKEKGITGRASPRWARVNTLKTTLEIQLKHNFAAYQAVETVAEVVALAKDAKVLHCDKHVPNLLAFPPDMDLTRHQAYLNGELILQDKASCFPAHLLVSKPIAGEVIGDAIDGCAAPGNKTTHMAALMKNVDSDIFACERDSTRSKTLQMMVDKAGAGKLVKVLARQDFLALDPREQRFSNVTHLLLDPSCSGSGILGREDIPELKLPNDPRKKDSTQQDTANSKKRKRGNTQPARREQQADDQAQETIDPDPTIEEQPVDATQARLEKLSNLQSRIVEHAMTFPAATRITYSTCSVHVEENEAVVARVLNSTAGQSRRWTVLRRQDQVSGMQDWTHRGVQGPHGLSAEQIEACIRCTPGDGEGTMGFFVCGFVRNPDGDVSGDGNRALLQEQNGGVDEWEGFSDA